MKSEVAHLPYSAARLIAAAGIGGVVGSALRGGIEWMAFGAGLPGWTARIVVNVMGAFVIGVLFARLASLSEDGTPIGIPHHNRIHEHRFGSGFLGGFTTVSGFAWDVATALHGNDLQTLFLVLIANGIVGIVAAAAGFAIGRWWRRRV